MTGLALNTNMSREFSHLVGEDVPVYGRKRFRVGVVVATRGRDAMVRLNNGDTIFARIAHLRDMRNGETFTVITESNNRVPHNAFVYQQVNIPIEFIQKYCSIKLRPCPDEEPSPSW